MAKIKQVSGAMILFEDGSKITYDHDRDCCEDNYADFEQIDDIAMNTDFDTNNMLFESVDGSGFSFGNENKMFFVPCYSDQNGYYTDHIDIYYNNKVVLGFSCEERIY